jgi:putative ABC transport system substrate-binding protein
MRRREFMTLIGGAAAWPLAAHAQPPAIPVIGFLSTRSPEDIPHLLSAFLRGLAENGYVEGQNVTIEYRWALGQYDRLPALAAELAGRPVVVRIFSTRRKACPVDRGRHVAPDGDHPRRG